MPSKLKISVPCACLTLIAGTTAFAGNPTTSFKQSPVGRVNAAASQPTQLSSDVQAACALYQAQKYQAAADAFEALIRTSPANAKLYYYAALSSRGSGRNLRAKQLCQFIVANFSNSAESSLAKAMFPSEFDKATKTTKDEEDLPESVKAALPPAMQAMLQTPEGRAAIREAMAKDPKSFATVRAAEKKGLISQTTIKAAKTAMTPKPVFGAKTGRDRPFTAEDIARDGAHGIDQSRFPNCWFEASMSSLAELPRGQALMASMIRYGDKNSYVVRFPGDGKEYVVTEELLEETGIHDKALWASIIECAQVQKFPDNQGAEGAESNQSRLEVGLGCITGCKAEVVMPANCAPQELSRFIGAAISSKNPIVAGTYWAGVIGTLPSLVVPQHAYTVTGFDAARNMITIRNPHGANARRFALPSDPNHQEFEQLNDGEFKMSIPLFQKYFHSVARSFI